jgi:phage shock protein A
MTCDNLKAETGECQNKVANLEQQLSAAPNVMPKSKALVKQAKMIARLAEAVTDVVELHENYTDGTQTDSDAFESLLLRLREWEEKHDALIEAARDE